MKTLLITGSNRGIGLEFARRYSQAGWNVIACCRTPEQAKELQKTAIDNPGLSIVKLDVRKEGEIEEVTRGLGNIALDLVICNAGIYGPRDPELEELTFDTWMEILAVNAVAPLVLAKHVKPLLLRAEQPRFVVISSKMGSISDNTSGGCYPYRSSKAALNAACFSLALDWKKHGIAIGILNPGWVLTDMGGPNALISVETSVSNMIGNIERLNLSNSGEFLHYNGDTIPW